MTVSAAVVLPEEELCEGIRAAQHSLSTAQPLHKHRLDWLTQCKLSAEELQRK